MSTAKATSFFSLPLLFILSPEVETQSHCIFNRASIVPTGAKFGSLLGKDLECYSKNPHDINISVLKLYGQRIIRGKYI